MKLTSELSAAADICHVPISLSKGFTYGTVCDNLPFSHLLKKNAMFDMLQTADPIYLSHQTKYLENISASGIVRRGNGCLASVLYTTPLYGSEGNIHDNFFTLVLSHQSQSESAAIDELIAVVPNTLDGVLYGTNYLRAGTLLAEIAAQSIFIDINAREEMRLLAKEIIRSSDFRTLITTDDIKQAYQALQNLAVKVPFFAHLYYESLTQVIMLSSRDELTEMLAKKGEFNAHNFYDVLFARGAPEGDRYDTSCFSPNYADAARMLRQMIDNGQIAISVEETLEAVLRNIREFIHSLGERFALVTQIEGQMYLTTLNYELLTRLLASFSSIIDEYRRLRGISLVINVATLKQEFGVLTEAASFAVRDPNGGELVRKSYVLGGVTG